MIAIEVQKIKRGCAATGFDKRGIVVEFASAGAARTKQFSAAHLIDSLNAAGLDAAVVTPPAPDRSRLYVTKGWGTLDTTEVYNVFRDTEGVDVSTVLLA